MKRFFIVLLLLTTTSVYCSTNTVYTNEYKVNLYQSNQTIITPYKGLFFSIDYAQALLHNEKVWQSKHNALLEKIKKKDELLLVRDNIINNNKKEIQYLNDMIMWKDREVKLYKDTFEQATKISSRNNLEKTLWFLGGCAITALISVGTIEIVR